MALGRSHRCLAIDLPGFERPARRAFGDDEMVAHIHQAIEREFPGEMVTLVLHDWGCVYGFALAIRHPELVSRIVAVDVGDGGSRRHLRELGIGAKLAIAAYQLWLALAWVIGGRAGNVMSRALARLVRAPAAASDIHWGMAYPYAVRWLGVAGGAPKRARIPDTPMLYIYGERKPIMFHSRGWLREMAARPGNAAVGLPSGHWPMATHAGEFNRVMEEWLTRTRQ